MTRFILPHCLEIFAMLCAALAAPSSAYATAYSWNYAGNAFFGGSNNWTPNGVPNANDTATFAVNSAHSVFFAQDASVHDLTVAAGNVMFSSSGGSHSISVNSSDTSTVSLPNSNGGTTLTLGDVGAA